MHLSAEPLRCDQAQLSSPTRRGNRQAISLGPLCCPVSNQVIQSVLISNRSKPQLLTFSETLSLPGTRPTLWETPHFIFMRALYRRYYQTSTLYGQVNNIRCLNDVPVTEPSPPYPQICICGFSHLGTGNTRGKLHLH